MSRTPSTALAGFPLPFFHCLGGRDEDAKGMKSARSRLTTRLLFALLLVVLVPIPDALADCTDPPGPGVNWRRCVFDRLEFKEVDLTGAELRDASFFRTDLSGSNFEGVKAFRAKFFNAVMTGARFPEADLREADMSKAHLQDADLATADLRRARLFDADLRGADLTGAKLEGADLTGANLSGATWTDGKKVCNEGSIGRCN